MDAVILGRKRKRRDARMGEYKIERLRKIPIRYLWDGMVLSDDLYNGDGKVLLIRAGEVITTKTLERLEKLGTKDSCVMTYETSYREIMNHKSMPPEIQQMVVEDRLGYTELKKDVQHFLGIVAHAAEAEHEVIESVTEEVAKKIQIMDFQDFFRCINVPRALDDRLQRHSLNIAFLNGMMGYWLKLSDDEIQMLVMAGLLHDIGKARIPEQILYAPRKLTDEEYEVMKKHPIYSYELLDEQFDDAVRDAVLHHHERPNGTGYPDGISGNAVSKFARITSICDVYDALVSVRDYKEARLPFDILAKMKKGDYVGLDPELTAIFVKNMVKYFRKKQVVMSDGSVGVVAYIPPNDISHPVIVAGDVIKQADEEWYCKKVMDEMNE